MEEATAVVVAVALGTWSLVDPSTDSGAAVGPADVTGSRVGTLEDPETEMGPSSASDLLDRDFAATITATITRRAMAPSMAPMIPLLIEGLAPAGPGLGACAGYCA